ncbi:DUF1840 domain-containing protein [Legionella drozanskii]|uniref:DUF1840 domain-containing protein n=1 Tax=Legionella drozanskii LLAP-1 TaxID=1212489 RepID=A0A0W0SWV0_9GAMM|nr:DUF1840 domain-containing protein [Legionella drozanskii]KTC87800.1 hypothetical protein Ldro_1419 [Legionella drozanskii LLAP-1]
MLVTFSCDAYENITMFGDVAKRLLSIMGHSGTVPGAIVAKEIPDALSRLEKGVSQKQTPPVKGQSEEEDDEQPVSLANRALPLINMLKAASKQQCNVMWK